MILAGHLLERPSTSPAPTTSKIRPINHHTQLPLIGATEEVVAVAMSETVGADKEAAGVLVTGTAVLVWVAGMLVELGVGETGNDVDVE